MLVGLSIRDVVLIDRLDLAFSEGLSVLTGETGAGKSILLDALGLALGARAESGLVRNGAKHAVVTAEFALPGGHAAHAVLDEIGVEPGERLILRRTVGADGRSRAFVDDNPVGVAVLKRIGDMLVEIQGQFDQRGLLDPTTHLDTLDAFGGHAGEAERVAALHDAWADARRRHAQARADLDRARAEEEMLRHAAGELDSLAPEPEEETSLAELRTVLANAEQVIQAMSAASEAIDGDGGAADAVARAQRELDRVAGRAGDRLDQAIAALDRATAELQEASAELAGVAADIETDAGRLEEVEDRLHALRSIARKHGVEPDALPALHADLAARLAALDEQGGGLAALAAAESDARRAYLDAAERLSKRRRTAAARLDKAVAGELPPLKMDRAAFATRVEPAEESAWSGRGIDRVVFEVATNPGAAPGPLNRIASGGELSRFLLALKVVLAEAGSVPTLVFDEVDAGVGGAVAAAVGERLSRLGDRLQVLVVTHSPQVAAKGAAHWHVAKSVTRADGGETTRTTVAALGDGDRREEIARMLAGATVTDEARAAADSLLRHRRQDVLL